MCQIIIAAHRSYSGILRLFVSMAVFSFRNGPLMNYLWPPYVIGQAIYIFILSFVVLLFFLSLISAVADWMSFCLPHFHTWCGLSVNLEYMSEMCCMWLAENTGRKKSPSGHNRTTFPSRAISSQRRHVSTIWKNLLNSNTSSTCPDNMVNFGLLVAEISLPVWGTPANFNGYRALAALLRSTPVFGVSQTLRCWTEGATYIWQGSHHVGHWPTFLVLVLKFDKNLWTVHLNEQMLQRQSCLTDERAVFIWLKLSCDYSLTVMVAICLCCFFTGYILTELDRLQYVRGLTAIYARRQRAAPLRVTLYLSSSHHFILWRRAIPLQMFTGWHNGSSY